MDCPKCNMAQIIKDNKSGEYVCQNYECESRFTQDWLDGERFGLLSGRPATFEDKSAYENKLEIVSNRIEIILSDVNRGIKEIMEMLKQKEV